MNKNVKKLMGFTLVELIVVIAVIVVLAAVFVPMLITYIDTARIGKINTNARHIYGAAVYAISDCVVDPSKGVIVTDAVYTGDASDLIAYSNGGGRCNMANYLGSDFTGYFAFETDSNGSCSYALWSEKAFSASDVEQLTQQDIESKYIGCYPVKLDTP